ncbi:MAG: RHS repeat-associated core domain-containing protein, partial [Gammaproteobacteria bacterium]|nr:RHS repeat-associated core domain-containing protein [Gammaproteobacteria bacterium]
YRTVTAMDARGNVTAETLGNGATRTHAFDGRTGRLTGIQAGKSSTKDLQNLAYQWDALGNLKSRASGEGTSALVETFGYDKLNRLRTHRVGTGAVQSTTYDGYGNVRSRTGVGSYAYGADSGASGRPHAVASVTKGQSTTTHAYDANGSLTSSSDGRTVSYAAFGKATSIAKGSHTSTFAHGPDRARFKRTDTDDMDKATTTLYIGSVERVTHPDATVTVRRRIGGTAIELEGPAVGSCEADAVRYVLRDHLGSVDRLVNAQGAVPQSMSFGAWGARRDPADWTALAEAAAASFDDCATRRGFTGHEMLDAVGTVHMNGRIYDPYLGRFLRADPFVQFPSNLQSHNRYSYALNNPLAHTDPSGHFIGALLAMHFVHKHVLSQNPLLNAVGQIAACAYGGIGGCISYAAHSAYAQTGSFRAALRAGAFSGISAAAFSAVGSGPFGYGVGDGLGQLGLNALANGLVGGTLSELQDGSFGHGFLSAGASALAKPAIRAAIGIEARGMPLRVAARAAVAGTISSATGGKFLIGAVTGAFSQLFNEERTLARERAAKDHTLYVIGSNKLPAGHAAIAGETPDGAVEALGFYPKGTILMVLSGDMDGEVLDNKKLMERAKQGDPDVLIRSYRVTKFQHAAAMHTMRTYAESNSYNLYRNNCVVAVARSLQAAGLTNVNLKVPLLPAPHSVRWNIQHEPQAPSQ